MLQVAAEAASALELFAQHHLAASKGGKLAEAQKQHFSKRGKQNDVKSQQMPDVPGIISCFSRNRIASNFVTANKRSKLAAIQLKPSRLWCLRKDLARWVRRYYAETMLQNHKDSVVNRKHPTLNSNPMRVQSNFTRPELLNVCCSLIIQPYDDPGKLRGAAPPKVLQAVS